MTEKKAVATIKLIFEDPGYNFEKDWWAPVDVTEPTVWYYPCYSDKDTLEMLQIFNEWPGMAGVEVIY